MKNIPFVLLGSCLMLFFVVTWFCSCSNPGTDSENSVVVARVEERELLSSDLGGLEVDKKNRGLILNRWIKNQLINIYGDVLGVRVDGRQEELIDELTLRSSEILNNTVYNNISISTDEVRNYYLNNVGAFIREKNCALMFVVNLKTENDADSVAIALKRGGGREHNVLSQNNLSWGGVVKEGDLISPFNDAVFGRRKSVVGPINTKIGFLVAHVLDFYDEGSVEGIDEVYDKIYSLLYLEKRGGKYKALIDSLSSNTDIFINEAIFNEN